MIDGHLTETVQWTTLAIAIGVVIVAVMCFHSLLWDPWTRAWSIEDIEWEIAAMGDELFGDRDQHPLADRAAMRDARGVR